MNGTSKGLENLKVGLEKCKQYFLSNVKDLNSSIQIYTHIDADGISSGAILGKALYRESMPFQISILKQLEREEIEKIASRIKERECFIIFSDFGSGQYLELQKLLSNTPRSSPFIILDHHLPQNIPNKEEIELLESARNRTSPWHVNPYFYGINGSIEISGAGMCYYFAKCLNDRNIDLSPIAIVGATGDIQNQGENKTFLGINTNILNDAIDTGYINVVNDLNFSLLKPLNEAIAYSSDFKLPGLSNDINRTLKFLQTTGVLMENPDGDIKRLMDLNKKEKQKISAAIIEYATIKLNIEPSEITQKLIVNKYLLLKEKQYLELYETNLFSYILNSCGRTNNGSLGIALAMGDRNNAYKQAREILKDYRKLLVNGLRWIYEKQKIQKKENIQYFFGEDQIPESVIGVIASMLVFDSVNDINKKMPIFGIAKRDEEEVYKISGRAHESIVNKGVNLSDAIRRALELSNLDVLGGGHPPAAGTKIPIEKVEEFLNNCDKVVKSQIQDGETKNNNGF